MALMLSLLAALVNYDDIMVGYLDGTPVEKQAEETPAAPKAAEPGPGTFVPIQLNAEAEEPVAPGNEEPIAPETEGPAAAATEGPAVTDETRGVLPEDSTFEIHFLDVGQGDGALILCDGHAMMIDGGPSSVSQFIYSYLKQRGVDYLDYVFASHPDADHIGGLAAALSLCDAGSAYCTGETKETRAYDSFIKKLGEHGLELQVPSPGDTFALGSAEVTVLAPVPGFTESDNTSLMIRIVYGDTSFLFTGDNEAPDEAAFLSMYASSDTDVLHSDVIKIAHHGSAYSSDLEFLRAISPSYAVISVGRDNSYGHPTEQVLENIGEIGAALYRTDLQGTIICSSDGETISFITEKN